MPAYRRAAVPGGTFFFTVCLADRSETLLIDRIDLLRQAWVRTARETPFRTDAAVVLPDHLHAIWTLPPGDADFSTRWRRIKRNFTVALGETRPRSASKRARGEAGLWQRRFWEHCVREPEFDELCRYIWTNPVKHGYCNDPADWEFSSVHREIREGRL